MSFIYLDTETTGLYPPDDEVVELAIIDDEGKPLINTFIRPVHKTKWDDAERIHGINFDMVEGAPTILDIDDRIKEVVKGKDLIIYNKDYDTRFLQMNWTEQPVFSAA